MLSHRGREKAIRLFGFFLSLPLECINDATLLRVEGKLERYSRVLDPKLVEEVKAKLVAIAFVKAANPKPKQTGEMEWGKNEFTYDSWIDRHGPPKTDKTFRQLFHSTVR